MTTFLDYLAKPERLAAQPAAAPAVVGHCTPYARKALEGEVQGVMDAPEGTRNDRLNKAAFSMGQLVAGGEIAERDVAEALISAATVAGLESDETLKTIKSGLISGQEHPRNGSKTWTPTNGTAPPASSGSAANTASSTTPGTRSVQDGELTPEQEAEAQRLEAEAWFNRQVADEVQRLRIREEARTVVGRDVRPDVPTALSLTNALALPVDPLPWRIDGLMPREGICLFSAPQKAGKTTMMGNLARSLVDGDKFLDAFDVDETCKVTLIDTELGERRLYDWLRDQKIRNTDMLNTVSLRGREAALDPRDPKNRAAWVDILSGSGVVVLDVVGPVVAALGLDESDNADVGRFWTAWRTLLVEAGVPAGLVVHHTGHDERRAIGASSWLRYPDAIWKIEREDEEPTSPRYFSAYGRDVDVYQGSLTFSQITRRLAYTGKSKAKTKASRNAELLADLLREHGPQNQTACVALLHNAHGVSRDAGRSVPAQGVRDGLLVTWKSGKSDVYGVVGVHVAGVTA